ncbi:MAG: hypothetical protein Q9165_001119 [Trypethelium subeluteriae]
MADPLSIIGGLTAGMQLVSTAAQALLATIKLVKDLKDVPERLSLLLGEVEGSICRLCNSCNADSTILQNLDISQRERLSRSASILYPALQEIRDMLMPLMSRSQGKRSVRGLWKSLVSLKVEKELTDKLQRLNRLNMEMIQELGMVGLEVQVATHGLVMANNAASSEAFSNIGIKMDSLRDDFHDFTLSIQQVHATTLENQSNHTINSQKRSSPPKEESFKSSRRSSSSNSLDLICTPGSTVYTQEPADEERLTQERAEQMRRYLTRRPGADTASALSVPSTSKLSNTNLELILFTTQTFYTLGNFDASSKVTKTEFWKDLDLAVYLMKVSTGRQRGASKSQIRGLRLLKKLTADDATNTLDQSTSTIIIELLSTLSPVNTTSCSYIRKGILEHLSSLARDQLPRDHPIALVINVLKNDNDDKYVSLRALTFIAERLRTTLGAAHELTQLATKRLSALLRRSGDHSEALRVTRSGVRAIRATVGPGSLAERLLLRQLAHVYMDQEDWASALSVCFDVVGHQQLDLPNPDPLYHDECAVYTMEDIAKTCECVGNLEQAVAWLKQARISGGMVWGRTQSLSHIQDKLSELLTQIGKEEALKIWTMSWDPGDGGD